MAIKLWIDVAIQLQNIRMMKRYKQRSMKCSRGQKVNDQLYEVELAKSEIEHREPVIVGFFILEYAKLRMLELHYNFFTKFCDTDKYEKVEMDTD